MPDRECGCGVCGHRSRTPEGMACDNRMLMYPACGSVDLSIRDASRQRPPVMRARIPARASGARQPARPTTP